MKVWAEMHAALPDGVSPKVAFIVCVVMLPVVVLIDCWYAAEYWTKLQWWKLTVSPDEIADELVKRGDFDVANYYRRRG